MSARAAVDVAVIGAGPAGLAAALAMAALGVDVVLAAPPHDPVRARADRRTTALIGSSVDFLINLGVWEACAGAAAALEGIRIVDDRGDLLRAPEVLFMASELGLSRFGANVPNPVLTAALAAAVARAPRIRWQATAAVERVEIGADDVKLALAEGGSISARLVVAADGRQSRARAAAGIATRSWTYPQSALALSFQHERAHGAVTTELHRRQGPLTVVPLPGNASSLVWVESPGEAQRLCALDDAAFGHELEARLHGLLGGVRDIEPRAAYPLSGLSAARMAHKRIALVGEAAHVIPPIGAQGLNLGLRDAAAIAECAADALARGDDAGAPSTLAIYERARAADVESRALAVDLLNRSLIYDFLPVQALRGIGLHLLASLKPVRRLAMQAGMAPAGPLPRLMRRDAST